MRVDSLSYEFLHNFSVIVWHSTPVMGSNELRPEID